MEEELNQAHAKINALPAPPAKGNHTFLHSGLKAKEQREFM